MSDDETCVVCGRTKPISRMRYGTYKEEVGSHVTRSGGTRSGNRHSTSFGGHGGTRIGNSYSSGRSSRESVRTDYRKVKGWACRYHGLLGRIVTRLVLVAVIAWVGFSYLSGKFGHARPSSPDSVVPATDDKKSAKSVIVRTDTLVDPTPPHRHSTESVAGTDALAPIVERATTPMTASITTDPQSDPKVAAAIANAASSGEPVRWHSQHMHGYAVPSVPDAAGCRMVQVSVDKTGEQSSAIKICP